MPTPIFYKGRNKYSGESKEKFLEKHNESVGLIKRGFKHVEISKITGVHMNTLTKIKRYVLETPTLYVP